MEESSETREMSSGVTGKPGTAYDAERVGEPGQPGVPTGDQHPVNEGDGTKEIAADVNVPGPYPSGQGDPTGKPLSPETEPTEASRTGGSLGNLTEDTSTSSAREETGGLGSPLSDDEKRTDK
jgi:hypothetical protein